jgi:DNA modification methylase
MRTYEVFIGDSRVELAKLTGRKYKAVITSPPYNIGKGYATYQDKRIEISYQIMLRDVFRECVRMLTPDGLLFINIADEAANWFRSHDAMKVLESQLPIKLVHRIVWKKPYVQALAVEKQLGFAHEFIFVFAKTDNYRFKYYESNDVWEFYARKGDTDHPAVYPPELPIRCAKLVCNEGDWILDPFGGTGTTIVAARELGLNATICELSKEYIPDIKKNIRWGQSLDGDELFQLYYDGLLQEQQYCAPPISVSWSEGTDEENKPEEPLKEGLAKWF